jgi:hypothetical protein
MVALPGPTKAIPASSHRSANEARSETNPQPTQTASQADSTSAATTAVSSRYRDLR